MFEYSYQKEDIISNQLTEEIKGSSISAVLSCINTEEQDISIFFETELSTEESNVLDTIISNHPDENYTLTPSTGLIQQIDINKSSKKTSYTTVGRIVYLGSKIIGNIIEVDAIMYMDSGVDSYDIRFVDKTNSSVIIAEKSGITNTEDAIIEITEISNLPSDKSRLDIQVRKNGGTGNTYVYLDSVLVKY